MKIDFEVIVKDLKGEDATYDGEILTLREACYIGLVAIRENKNIEPAKKYKQASLASKILGDNNVDLKVEEITLLKEVTGSVWGPAIIKSIWDLLDPPESDEPDKSSESKD